jgi:hypothetical protein
MVTGVVNTRVSFVTPSPSNIGGGFGGGSSSSSGLGGGGST